MREKERAFDDELNKITRNLEIITNNLTLLINESPNHLSEDEMTIINAYTHKLLKILDTYHDHTYDEITDKIVECYSY